MTTAATSIKTQSALAGASQHSAAPVTTIRSTIFEVEAASAGTSRRWCNMWLRSAMSDCSRVRR